MRNSLDKKRSHEARWNDRYQELESYFEIHGHSDVPRNYEENPSLANWVAIQRSCYKKKTLKQQRIDLLNKLNFTWSINGGEDSWNQQFQELINYNEKNGHTNVPSTCKEYPLLSLWVRAQRQCFKQNKLEQKKIDRLNSVGFQFELRKEVKRTGLSWNDYFLELKKFEEAYGHTFPSSDYLVKGTVFREWVSHQRIYYRMGKLTEDQMKKLDGLNVMEVSRDDFDWESRYKELVKFKELNGHCRVPLKMEGKRLKYFKEQRLSFGKWVAKQRTLYKKGELSQERIEKLNAINFNWKSHRDESWDKKFQELMAYKEEYGTVNFVTWNKQHQFYSLSLWAVSQRNCYRNHEISKDKVAELEGVGFEWDIKKVEKIS